MNVEQITIRPLEPTDSVAEIHDLVRRAYARLAAMNLRFWATYQTKEETTARIAGGECLVASLDGRIVGTVLFQDPARTGGHEWYDRAEVASFSQFAVEPALQGTGIGRALLDAVERRARASGARELALDTAKPATHLIEMYQHLGYRIVGEVDWRPATNYLSVTLSKAL